MIVALVAVVLVGGYLLFRGGRVGQPTLSAAEACQLIHTKNVALGNLENQKVQEGTESFQQITAKLPVDPLGPRNLAVARVLALGSEDQPATETAVEEAQSALKQLLAVEGITADYHWLAYRVELAAKNYQGADDHLASIVGDDSKNAAAWYARFRVGRLSKNEAMETAGHNALSRAYELNPLNAWLVVEWMRATGTQLLAEAGASPSSETAAEKFSHLADQLTSAEPTVQAFSYVIKTHARVDVEALLAEAIAAVEKGDFRTAGSRMLTLANVMLPHSTTDQQPVLHHPLESVLDRFQPAFYETHNVDEVESIPPIDVSLVPADRWQLPEQLQKDGGILSFQLADFDLDGRLDVVALTNDRLVVWGRDGESHAWKEMASLPTQGYSRLVVQDLDADFDETALAIPVTGDPNAKQSKSPALKNGCPSADVDVVLYGAEGVLIIENRHDAQTKERSLQAIDADKLPAKVAQVKAITCADLEADGDLDLVLSNESGLHLWSNNGNWSFTDISSRSSLPQEPTQATAFVALDWDRDVDMDVLVASPQGGGWLENVRHGQFRWHSFKKDGFEAAHKANSLAAVDADGDASWDVVATADNGTQIVFTTTPRPGVIRPQSTTLLSKEGGNSVIAWDYDNDGVSDLLVSSASQLQAYRGFADGRFEAVPLLAKLPSSTGGIDTGDIDGDGDLDLAVLSAGRISFFSNEGGNKNHWIDVALQAQQIKGQQHSPSGRVSPYGVGCLLELKSGNRYQAQIVEKQTTHFGIGQADRADVIRVLWLNGVPQNIIQPEANLFVCEQQVLNTSCPYLYTWNGKRFEFVTDLLWAAPLGLQFAEGELAPARDWEYLKISGEQLVPKDGEYVLQVTAELWEADYFDEIQLFAIDHPADVAIYSNEKVGPPEIAQYKVHTARQPRQPIAAVNQRGRNLLPELAKPDGIYAKAYDRKLRQGVAEDHYVELDFGDLGDPRHVTLFLTGWMFPSSTSINVALSQGGDIPLPKPPALLVPDSAGGWKEALPYMGFPGGKTKTIAVDLSGLLPARDHRVRIATSMEICWDHAFLTVDETPAEVRTTTLDLRSADLHERGFSRVVPDAGNGPERFLYDDVSLTPKWPTMVGAFTRLGQVKELLHASDDQLLVMGAGDEVTLRFAVPQEALPEGWKRDFFLYSVGWDKDANLVTVLGEAVEPLPFRAMSAYPWPPDENLPNSPAYEAYLRDYQTRFQSSAFWHAIRQFAPSSANSSSIGSFAKE